MFSNIQAFQRVVRFPIVAVDDVSLMYTNSEHDPAVAPSGLVDVVTKHGVAFSIALILLSLLF